MHSDADMLDEDYIKDYIKMGFEEVAFTDHCPEKNIIDKRPRIRMLYDQRIEYLQSIQNLKEKYKGVHFCVTRMYIITLQKCTLLWCNIVHSCHTKVYNVV